MHHARFGPPFFFGGPFVGGVLGGLLGSAILRPRPFYPPFYGHGFGYPGYYGRPFFW